MLRRLRIGGRINLLITVQLLALLAFAAIGYVALQLSDVKGTEREVIVTGGSLIAALLLLNFLLAIRLRRSVVRPARMLAARMKTVVAEDLPKVVAAARDFPSHSAVPHLERLDVDGSDELADLASSFNSLQDVTVGLALEQAAARRTVAENLEELSRRNQKLVARSRSVIASLEHDDLDPVARDDLFRLDHLSARMRRNALSLAVMAGVEPAHPWSVAVPIGDVIRAALSEVENFGQVELADVGEIGVQGALAGEVAHLLAELLENATSFSPLGTPVTVFGLAVPDGHELAICDQGSGMTTSELAVANEHLGRFSSFDRDSAKGLGLQVVARLSARLGVEVHLTSSANGSGTTAAVRLPAAILEEVSVRGVAASVAAFPIASERLSAPLPLADVAQVTRAAAAPR